MALKYVAHSLLLVSIPSHTKAIKRRVYGNYPITNCFHGKVSISVNSELVNRPSPFHRSRVAFLYRNSEQVNNYHFFQDCHIKTHSSSGEPVLDSSQDYVLLSSSENVTHTTLRFRRKLNTCDEKFDVPITVRV